MYTLLDCLYVLGWLTGALFSTFCTTCSFHLRGLMSLVKASPHSSASPPTIAHTLLFGKGALWKMKHGFQGEAGMFTSRTGKTQQREGGTLNWISGGNSPQWEYREGMSLDFLGMLLAVDCQEKKGALDIGFRQRPCLSKLLTAL